VRVLQVIVPATGLRNLMLSAVAVALYVMWPPTPRTQAPPPISSGCGSAGLPMNAVDWVKNAVFAALMEETSELTDAVAPAMPATPGLIICGDMRSPVAVHCAWAVGVQASNASAASTGMTPSRHCARFALRITTPRCPVL
jgi:hypothetical protein